MFKACEKVSVYNAEITVYIAEVILDLDTESQFLLQTFLYLDAVIHQIRTTSTVFVIIALITFMDRGYFQLPVLLCDRGQLA